MAQQLYTSLWLGVARYATMRIVVVPLEPLVK